MEFETKTRCVFDRLGGSRRPYYNNQVCSFWVAGKCTRNPCRFLHSIKQPYYNNNNKFKYYLRDANESSGRCSTNEIDKEKNVVNVGNSGPVVQSNKATVSSSPESDNVILPSDSTVESKKGRVSTSEVDKKKKVVKVGHSGPVVQSKNAIVSSSPEGATSEVNKDKDNVILDSASTVESKKGRVSTSCFYLQAKLERHGKAVTGIALPSGFDKLFTGYKDGSACVWDCNSGQCVNDVNLGAEIRCMISESPWVFVGSQNAVHAWNMQTQTEVVLNGPNGLVNAIVVGYDILFAGVEDGSICAWKSSSETSCPQVLRGHTQDVTSLTVGAARLYSGSKDETIRVWDIITLECMQALKAHNDSITSLIYCDNYLISGSLDKTLKVWGAAESGDLGVVYENKQESAVLAMCRTQDGKANPILVCSCKDNSLIYELPSFAERGRIFSKGQVSAFEIGCGGRLFFTGDATGQVSVWKLEDQDKS